MRATISPPRRSRVSTTVTAPPARLTAPRSLSLSVSTWLSFLQLMTNDSGLSYMSVPLSSPTLDDHDVHGVAGSEAHPDGSGGTGGGSAAGAVNGLLSLKASPSAHPRLLSLDCFRGLTIAWMIMSDEGGEPWSQHTLTHIQKMQLRHARPRSELKWKCIGERVAHTPLSAARVCLACCVRCCCSACWIDHSPWNGIHFADFVFPAFVFIVGMVRPLASTSAT